MRSFTVRTLRLLAILASLLSLHHVGSGSARAVDFYISYNVNLEPGIPNITNILIRQTTENGGGISWPYEVQGGPGGSSVTLHEGFLKKEPIVGNILIGLTQGLPNNPPDQKHVVLMISDVSAALAKNIAWGTLFPTVLESDIINAIELATSGSGMEIVDPALDIIESFLDGPASSILGPGGIPTSTFFGMNDNFTVMAFSDGTFIGNGNSFTTAVPEPSTYVLGAIAVAVIGFARKSRRNDSKTA